MIIPIFKGIFGDRDSGFHGLSQETIFLRYKIWLIPERAGRMFCRVNQRFNIPASSIEVSIILFRVAVLKGPSLDIGLFWDRNDSRYSLIIRPSWSNVSILSSKVT